jgi:hypothetical protein
MLCGDVQIKARIVRQAHPAPGAPARGAQLQLRLRVQRVELPGGFDPRSELFSQRPVWPERANRLGLGAGQLQPHREALAIHAHERPHLDVAEAAVEPSPERTRDAEMQLSAAASVGPPETPDHRAEPVHVDSCALGAGQDRAAYVLNFGLQGRQLADASASPELADLHRRHPHSDVAGWRTGPARWRRSRRERTDQGGYVTGSIRHQFTFSPFQTDVVDDQRFLGSTPPELLADADQIGLDPQLGHVEHFSLSGVTDHDVSSAHAPESEAVDMTHPDLAFEEVAEQAGQSLGGHSPRHRQFEVQQQPHHAGADQQGQQSSAGEQTREQHCRYPRCPACATRHQKASPMAK